MDLFKFVFFSSLEYFSSFIFILVQFRFSVRDNIDKILLISILLSFVSYSLITADMRYISPVIQNAIFLIYIWVILKVSLPNSFVMLLTGYTVFGLVQTCIYSIFAHLGLSAGEPVIGASTTYQLQLYSALVMIVLSLIIYFMKGGFSFIESRSRVVKKPISRQYKLFLAYILLAFLVTMLTNIYLLSNGNPSYPAAVFSLVVVLVVLFYLTFKRDEQNG